MTLGLHALMAFIPKGLSGLLLVGLGWSASWFWRDAGAVGDGLI